MKEIFFSKVAGFTTKNKVAFDFTQMAPYDSVAVKPFGNNPCSLPIINKGTNCYSIYLNNHGEVGILENTTDNVLITEWAKGVIEFWMDVYIRETNRLALNQMVSDIVTRSDRFEVVANFYDENFEVHKLTAREVFFDGYKVNGLTVVNEELGTCYNGLFEIRNTIYHAVPVSKTLL